MAEKNTRAHILATTRELLIAQGYSKVTTRDVTERAGVSRSHIYHYFSDWPTLRREAFLGVAEHQLEQTRAAIEGLPPAQALETFVRECLVGIDADIWTLWQNAWEDARVEPELAQAHLALDNQWIEMLKDILEAGAEDGVFAHASHELAARQLFMMIIGYAEYLAPSSPLTPDQAFQEVMAAAAALTTTKAQALS